MKKIFVTFADSRLSKSSIRLFTQAEQIGVYDEIFCFNEFDLDEQFVHAFSDKLSSKVRGFGYWVWKPQIILQVLDRLEDGDILQYTDVGCHINIFGRDRLLDYFDLTNQSSSGLLGFQAFRPQLPLQDDGRNIPTWIDGEWTKGDLLDYFNVRHNPLIVDTPTIQSGVFFLRKEESTVRLIKEWLSVYYANFSLADDSASLSPNPKDFKEHRHDQSIFSILMKMADATTVSASEFWYPKKDGSPKGDWNYLKKFPIHAKRDLDYGIATNFKIRFRKQFDFELNRIKKLFGANKI